MLNGVRNKITLGQEMKLKGLLRQTYVLELGFKNYKSKNIHTKIYTFD